MTPADLPLAGMGVVVTRDEDSDDALSRSLRGLGATVLNWPTVRPAPPSDRGPLEHALGRLGDFDWIAFTSPRAVEAVAERVGVPPRGLRVGAVGSSTRAAAISRGWHVAVVARPQTAEALVAALADAGVAAGTRVLFPASEIAHDTLEAGLRSRGAEVVRVTAYRTLPATLDRAECARALETGGVEVITFTSPSALENLRAALGEAAFASAAERVVMAAIGPTTAAALRAAGAAHVIEATEHSLAGLTDRIAEWGRDQRMTGAS